MQRLGAPMLTIKEVAELVRKHPETVRVMIRRGKLPAVKVGRTWLMRESDVEQMLRVSSPPVRR